MVDLVGRHQQVADEVEERVLAVLRGGRYIGGEVVAEAEATAARWLGRRGAIGVNCGTDALALALQAAGVLPGDEVIVPALTFFATAGSVVAIGAVPVVVDVREDALMDPEAAVAAVTARTTAVVPVHLYGNHAEAPPVEAAIVDDSAQAIGSDPPASLGVLSSVSTYPTKTWGAAGDGGFVVGDDPELLARVRQLANHGLSEPHLHHPIGPGALVGRNTRLDAVQAAVLCGHATQLPARMAARRRWAARYDAGMPDFVRPLPRTPGSAVHQYVVRHPRRDQALQALQAADIHAAVYYPRSLAHQPALARFSPGPTPVADALVAELLALPVHAGLTVEDVDRVLAVLHET